VVSSAEAGMMVVGACRYCVQFKGLRVVKERVSTSLRAGQVVYVGWRGLMRDVFPSERVVRCEYNWCFRVNTVYSIRQHAMTRKRAT
jgi:hypothetical protein